uniref:Uncharacterized protein n=1 Tax=Sphaerodactylus townsendi TaxID=933632 RepID=A0ACB8FMV1_9SAUR
MPRPLLTGCSHSRCLNEEEEEIQPCFHHQNTPPPPDHLKNRINSGDNQLKDLGDPATFSSKGMPKNKSHSTGRQHEPKSRTYRKKMARQTLGLEKATLSPEQLGLGLEFQRPLYQEAVIVENLSEDDDDWRERYPLPAYDKVHLSRMPNVAPCNPYSYNSPSPESVEAFSTWPFSGNDQHNGCPTHTKVECYAPCEEPIENVAYTSSHLSYDELKEENSLLRRKIKRIQNFSESQAQMVRNLERKLQTTNKEEKETQDLEALMEKAEHSLQFMTQRALRAESDLEKAKQEMCFLQAELACYKMENESLRSGQSGNMGAVKHHIDVALQNLLRVTNHAHATIHQLVFGTETLTLVADLLKSKYFYYIMEY